MKIVLANNSDVAHTWAHQSQQEARSSNGQFYFYGETIYSYGRHFPIARFVTDKKGNEVILFTNRSYSVSTGKHISLTRNAIPYGKTIIYCHTPSIIAGDREQNFHQWLNDMEGYLLLIPRARKPEKHIASIRNTIDAMMVYCETFGFKVPKTLALFIKKFEAGDYETYLASKAKALKAEENKRLKKQRLEHGKQVEQWRTKPGYRLYGRVDRDYLRINHAKARIETSQGIEIPLATARVAYIALKSVLENPVDNWSIKILEYEVKELNKKYLTIGCHRLYWDEIEMLAQSLGFNDSIAKEVTNG